jgi:hypothetical protein
MVIHSVKYVDYYLICSGRRSLFFQKLMCSTLALFFTQVCCGPNLEITHSVVKWPGRVHDSRIFVNSSLYETIHTEGITDRNIFAKNNVTFLFLKKLQVMKTQHLAMNNFVGVTPPQ